MPTNSLNKKTNKDLLRAIWGFHNQSSEMFRGVILIIFRFYDREVVSCKVYVTLMMRFKKNVENDVNVWSAFLVFMFIKQVTHQDFIYLFLLK